MRAIRRPKGSMSATHYHPILGGTDQCSHGRFAYVCPLSLTTCHNFSVKVALNQEMYKSFEVDIFYNFYGAKYCGCSSKVAFVFTNYSLRGVRSCALVPWT